MNNNDKYNEQDSRKQESIESRRYNKILLEACNHLDNAKKIRPMILGVLNLISEYDLAFHSALAQLKVSMDDNIDFTGLGFAETYNDKLTKILFLNHMIPILGLIHLQDEIMEEVIKEMFGPKQAQPKDLLNQLLANAKAQPVVPPDRGKK